MKTIFTILLSAFCFVVLAGPFGLSPNLESGLVGWWNFNSFAIDSSGYGNNLTAIGSPLYYPGIVGGAASLNGTSQYFQIPSASIWKPTNSITLTGWWWATNTTGWDKIIVCDYRANGTWTTPYSAWDISISQGTSQGAPVNNSRQPGFVVATTGGVLHYICSTNVFSTNQWHFVAGTYDGTNLNLYIDGKSVAAPVTVTGPIDYGTGTNASIGRDSQYVSSPTEYLNGMIDDVRVYNRALAASEIQQLYNGGYGTP